MRLVRGHRLLTPQVELGSALAAVVLAFPVAAVLIVSGAMHLNDWHPIARLVDGVYLGPILAAAGAWLDTRRERGFGLLALALATLLALDGAIGTYLLALPLFVLVAVSFGVGVARRTRV